MAYTAIDDSSAYFKVQLYTGNGSANHAITFDDTDTNMQPDLVWIKNRSQNDGHCIFDAARGATKLLDASVADGETTDADTLDSFASDGFQVDADVKVNTNTETYVAWCWKGGTTSGIDTTNTTITPDAYSFNATSGVSIIKYDGNGTSGAKVAHGLGAIPEVVIIKTAGSSNSWAVYHHKNTSAPETDYLFLDTSGATADDAGYWNDTTPTQYNVVLGGTGNTNGTGGDNPIVGYCFASKQGFSKFGTYKGDGNAANLGPFIYTGFKPALVITKPSSEADAWSLWDNKRPGYNDLLHQLFCHANSAESAGAANKSITFCSNGFKITGSDAGELNKDGDTYIYLAFAEAPFVNSEGVPATSG